MLSNTAAINHRRIGFRTDASVHIGSGHVMRCLALARYLQACDVECVFFCRQLEANMIDFLLAQGFEVYGLSAALALTDDAGIARDGEQCQAIIRENYQQLDALVVDHYDLDSRWESALSEYTKKMIVVDDLADRFHYCDVLIDQGGSKVADDYKPWVQSSSQLLLGPQYALLRDEFSKWRKAAHVRRKTTSAVKKILINVGGADNDNISLTLLQLIETVSVSDKLDITVVVGGLYRYRESLNEFIAGSRHSTSLLTGVNNMAELMSEADFSIGAAGISTWERCCLSLPSMTLCVADNQIDNCQYLEQQKAAVVIWCHEPETWRDDFLKQFNLLMSQQIEFQAIAEKAYQPCDGLGCYRVAHVILQEVAMDFYEAGHSEKQRIYDWQRHESTRQYALNPTIPTWEEHSDWFDELLSDEQRRLYIATQNDEPVGLFRLDAKGKNKALISILITPGYYGKGLATTILKFVRRWWSEISIEAVVLPENVASQRAFEKAGFIACENGFVSRQ